MQLLIRVSLLPEHGHFATNTSPERAITTLVPAVDSFLECFKDYGDQIYASNISSSIFIFICVTS